jgi:hypothetical protein
MTSEQFQYDYPRTAQEVFNMHPSVSASRERTGSIEVKPFLDVPSRFVGLTTVIGLTQQRGDPASLEVVLTSYLNGIEHDTQLSCPFPGSIHEPSDVIMGRTKPRLVVVMARAGIDLLGEYARLSPNERKAFSRVPYGNEKAYDFVGHDLQVNPTLIAAHALLRVSAILPE